MNLRQNQMGCWREQSRENMEEEGRLNPRATQARPGNEPSGVELHTRGRSALQVESIQALVR